MTGNIVIKCLCNDNKLPSTKLKINRPSVNANICNSKADYEIWHKRLGHMSNAKFNKLKCNKMIDDM